jgi:hypothetical protein
MNHYFTCLGSLGSVQFTDLYLSTYQQREVLFTLYYVTQGSIGSNISSFIGVVLIFLFLLNLIIYKFNIQEPISKPINLMYLPWLLGGGTVSVWHVVVPPEEPR